MPATLVFDQRRILACSGRARSLLYVSIACRVAAAATVVAQAWLFSQVIARVFLGDDGLGQVQGLLLTMLALALVRAALLWVADVVAQRAASEVKGRLRADLTHHLLALGPAFTHGERSGELAHVLVQAVEDLDEYLTAYQPLRALAVLVPLLVALVVLVTDPLTVLVLVVTGPMLVLFLVLIGSRTKDLTQRRFRELSWMSASFLDMLHGLATLKMFGRSQEQVDNIRDVGRRYGHTTMEVLRTAFETSLVLELSSTIATALVAVEVSLRLIAGDLPFDRALFLLVITPEFFAPLRQLATRYHAGSAGRAAGERIFAILDTSPAASPPRRAASSVPFGDIRLEHVSFAYDGGSRPALDDVSIDIPRGRTVALVGETGAGKTSVGNLLLRFFEPDSGRITVGGVPLGSLDMDAWRSQVAWVPQHPHFFYGTVEENIRLGKPGASRDEVLAAAQAAHLGGLLRRLPEGLHTVIGERGTRLSGGEQQRVAIARAFLKDAPVLILDEATSHLDVESEARILGALSRLKTGRSVLVIAHRMSLAYDADSVVVMQDGHVIGAGDHQSLLAGNGRYRTLVRDYESGTL